MDSKKIKGDIKKILNQYYGNYVTTNEFVVSDIYKLILRVLINENRTGNKTDKV